MRLYVGLALFVVIVLVLLTGVETFNVVTEDTLRSNLTTNYNPKIRPVKITRILLLFYITSIRDVDIKTQVFSVSGWWSMRWNDYRLTWDPTQNDNISILQFSETELWTPVLVVDNSVDDLTAIDEKSIPVRVDSTGAVTWSPPGILKVTCDMDITYFPFDVHTCIVQVTSFGFGIQEMNISVWNDGMYFKHFQENGEWDLVDSWFGRSTFTDQGIEYARVSYYLTVRRKPMYYGLTTLLPVFICMVMTMLVFLLPAESGEKIGYCLTVLLAFMVILTLVAVEMPSTSTNTSLLAVYIAMVLVMGGLAVVLSILSLSIFHRADTKLIPDSVIGLTKIGMILCCWRACCRKSVQPMTPVQKVKGSHEGQRSDSITLTIPSVSQRKPSWPRPHQVLSLHEKSQPAKESRDNDEEITWQTVSMVLDAVLFRMYLLLLLVTSVTILILLMVPRG